MEKREPSYTVGGNVNWCSHWKTVWRFLKKLKVELPYDPAIPLLCIYPGKTIIQKDTYTPVFTAALFTIAKMWKQLKCPSTEKWIKKMWYIYIMEYYSAFYKKEHPAICDNLGDSWANFLNYGKLGGNEPWDSSEFGQFSINQKSPHSLVHFTGNDTIIEQFQNTGLPTNVFLWFALTFPFQCSWPLCSKSLHHVLFKNVVSILRICKISHLLEVILRIFLMLNNGDI